MESNTYPGSYYQPLFDLLNQEHGITPLESEMTDIIVVVEKMRGKQPGAVWVKCSARMPPSQDRDLLTVKWYHVPSHFSVGALTANQLADRIKGNTELYYEWLDESAAAISQDAHEKEIMMQAFDKVRQIFVGRQWIMEGRGSYPYNDDRYQQEVRYIYDEFDQIVKDTWANIKSKSADYRKAIITEYLESAAGREDAVEFAEWAGWDWRRVEGKSMWENQKTLEVLSTSKLYEKYKEETK